MNPELTASLLGMFLTLAVFSYLLEDNPLFRLALNIFVGVTAGYLVFVIGKFVLMPWLVQRFGLGTWGERGLAFIPLALAVFLLLRTARISPGRFSGLSKIVWAFFIGVASAVAIGGALTGTLLPQTWGLMQTFERGSLTQAAQHGWLALMGYVSSGGMVLVGALATLLSFHYGNVIVEGQALTSNALFTWLRRIGKFFVAAALGVIFAGIFQAGLTALIERVQMFIDLLQGPAWPK